MRYYKVQVELGHLGTGANLPCWIYVKAKNIMHAINIARKFPAAKHAKLPPSAIQITKEEYINGRKSEDYCEKMEQIFRLNSFVNSD